VYFKQSAFRGDLQAIQENAAILTTTTNIKIAIRSNMTPSKNTIQAQKRTFPGIKKCLSAPTRITQLMNDFSLTREGSRIMRKADKVAQGPRIEAITKTIRD
jgi:hypothetical protein